MIQILEQRELPDWFQYPSQYTRLIRQNLVDLDPWVFMERDYLLARKQSLKERYPTLDLLPFARREDRDDVACWSKDDPGKVILIHDYASIDYLIRKKYDNFWEWFRQAIEDMIEYEP